MDIAPDDTILMFLKQCVQLFEASATSNIKKYKRLTESEDLHMYLENIKGPQDVKSLQRKDLQVLANQVPAVPDMVIMRTALLQKLNRHGGHIGLNLGMVEATIALHYVFDSPMDKMVFDVSHQSYCHKLLKGGS